MRHARSIIWLISLFFLQFAQISSAQISNWQLGGSGVAWDQTDSLQVLVDFDSAPGAIQPTYFTLDETVFSHIDNWAFFRDPSDLVLDYLDGEIPRMRKWKDGIPIPSENGSWLIDADPTTYNPPRALGRSVTDATVHLAVSQETFTMDLAVPVPAVAFGFIPPSEGFRSDGALLVEDFVPAFQVTASIAPEPPVLQGNVNSLSTFIADVNNNFAPKVRIDFNRQHLRFFRYRRTASPLDLDRRSASSNALIGSISEFQLFAHGVPQRSIYKTKITDLGEPVNFGRLFWKATPFRMVDGAPVEPPEAQAMLKIEVRPGRDDNPAVYHEYMDTGLEREVSREYFENDLRNRFMREHAHADIIERQPKPGIRASISYDSDNWTFWSAPFVDSGQPISLNSGSYLQLRITMESASFDDWVRLDSLWIETAPLLAGDVRGELARLDNPQPARGFTEVSLGEMTDFVYDLKADFATVDAPGFDLLRIRTGNRTQFKTLQLGEGLVATAPAEVTEAADGLLERITRANIPPLRVIFGTEVFEFATNFQSEVLDTEREVLPQPVVGADVGEALSTNSLGVLGISGESPHFVQDLNISPPVFTPNGDGINDELNISYALYRLPSSVPVVLDVYRLDGRRVAQIEVGLQDSGPQTLRWDGRNADGALLLPGIYLTTIGLLSDFSVAPQFRTVGIAY